VQLSRQVAMNIGQLAEQTGVSADTLRYYEREGLIEPPARAANGYRSYRDADAQRVRFVRSAQALGFSLAEIRGILPQFHSGRMDRRAIEAQLQAKISEIDGHIRQMQAKKRELIATFNALSCPMDQALTVLQATRRGPPGATSRASTRATPRATPSSTTRRTGAAR
jgi:MerR family copper efflux transcriptional regulator